MSVHDYLGIIEHNGDASARVLAAKGLLEELASGAELTPAESDSLRMRLTIEQDVAVATLLYRSVNRLRARVVLDRDPGIRFDPKLAAPERDALGRLVARLRTLIDEAQGAGEFDRRYEVVSKLADGGMADVFVGRRRADGASIVIKVLPERFLADGHVRERLRREARILGRLRHPNILRLYEWGEVGKQVYVVTEHVQGGDLAERIASGAVPLGEAKAILVQLLDALDACHRTGVVHRDVKPENVFLDRTVDRPFVKLGDFGIAKDATAPERLTYAGMTMGTPPFMAPEQRSNPVDVVPAADIYSFGVLAYELLSGGRFLTDDHQRLASLRPELSAEVDVVLVRCRALQPDQRPSAAELRTCLDRILSGERRP